MNLSQLDLHAVLDRFTDIIITGMNFYIMFQMKQLQSTRTYIDSMKEENRELKRELEYLTHRERVEKIKARRKQTDRS